MHLPHLFVALVVVSELLPLPINAAGGVSNVEKIMRLLNLSGNDDCDGRYCKGASPPPDSASANVVSVTVRVIRLVGVDMVKQLLLLDSWVTMKWTDSRLAWNETEDAELRRVGKIFVPLNWIWIPDLMVEEPIEMRNFENEKLLATVNSDGLVSADLPYGTTTKCDMNLQDFPFDSQDCSFTLSSAMKTSTELRLVVESSNDVQTFIGRSNEYCVTGLDSVPDNIIENYYRVLVRIRFKRKPLYYITVLIAPSSLILATCLFGFLLPADSSDRLALNVAILLSMTVFLQLAGSITPAQSESIPALTWYLTSALAVTALTSLENILVFYCHRRAELNDTVSSRILRFLLLNRLMGWKGSNGGINSGAQTKVSPVTEAPPDKAATMATEKALTQYLEDKGCDGSEWRHVASVTDLAMFAASVASSLIAAGYLTIVGLRNGSVKCSV